MRWSRILTLAGVVLLLTSNQAIAAIIYDAALDFSTTSNPNSPWSYQYASVGAANSTATLLGPYHWNPPENWAWFYHQWGYISLDNPWATDEPQGTLFVHPESVDMLLQFEFPGDFNPSLPVEATITVEDADPNGAPWYGSQIISFYNNENLISSAGVPNGWFAPFTLHSGEVQMGVGDVLTVRVNQDAQFNYDGVYLGVRYEQVPEPSTSLLLACGLAGLAAAGRRARH